MDFQKVVKNYHEADAKIDSALKANLLQDFDSGHEKSNITFLVGPLGLSICDRLYRMQYLNKPDLDKFESIQAKLRENPNSLDVNTRQWLSRFDASIHLMQSEAGLKTDNWFGSKSFEALQQVYSFEEATELDDWFGKTNSNSFLNRAVYVRLRVMGLVPGKARRFFEEELPNVPSDKKNEVRYSNLALTVEHCLNYWKQILCFWQAAGSIEAVTRENAIHWLFDTDGLTDYISNKAETLIQIHGSLKRPINWESWSGDSYPVIADLDLPLLSLRVLMAHARVEAWLHGFGSKLSSFGKGGDFYPGAPIDSISYSEFFKPNYQPHYPSDLPKLHPELKRNIRFWDDFEKVKNRDPDTRFIKETKIARQIKKGELTVAGISIRTVSTANRLNELPDEDERSFGVLNERYSALSKNSRRPKLWQQQGVGSTALDGIKRALKWVWKTVLKVFRKLSDFVRRVIRVVKSLAVSGMQFLNKVLKIVSDGIDLIINKVFVDSDKVKIVGDTDFDIITVVEPGLPNWELDREITILNKRVIGFRAACSIFSFLIEAFKIVFDLLKGRVWGLVDTVLFMANYAQAISEEDKMYLKEALAL